MLRSKGSLGESGETTHGFLGWVFAICIVYYIGMWVFDSIQETKHERIEKQRDWKAVGKF